MRTMMLIGVLALAGCGPGFEGGAPPPPAADAGNDAANAPPFVACQVLTPGDAGADTVRNWTCADDAIEIKWGWDGGSMSGSCAGSREAGCDLGSPCVVATADAYVQGGCL